MRVVLFSIFLNILGIMQIKTGSPHQEETQLSQQKERKVFCHTRVLMTSSDDLELFISKGNRNMGAPLEMFAECQDDEWNLQALCFLSLLCKINLMPMLGLKKKILNFSLS
jgi:hypothetical protein